MSALFMKTIPNTFRITRAFVPVDLKLRSWFSLGPTEGPWHACYAAEAPREDLENLLEGVAHREIKGPETDRPIEEADFRRALDAWTDIRVSLGAPDLEAPRIIVIDRIVDERHSFQSYLFVCPVPSSTSSLVRVYISTPAPWSSEWSQLRAR